MPSSFDRCVAAHHARWGEPAIVARAPGRVNLIGEHTDYNAGFALPMALPFDTVVAMSPHGDPGTGPVEIEAAGFGSVTFRPGDTLGDDVAWARYASGVVALLAEHDVPTGGWRASIDTDIPTGASLSSSAALEVALVVALLGRAGRRWTPVEIARLGQRVENEVVGVPSGIMDQLIVAGAELGHASLMDCRDLSLRPAPLPSSVVVTVLDSGTRRSLVEGAYAERRASCERAAAALGVAALRDAGVGQLDMVPDPVDRRRAHHVITENERTQMAAEALAAGDVAEVGRLMSASHRSLRDDYQVSGPGLDAIVDVASTAPGCLGARMTGGGFAGCAVALVERDASGAFAAEVRSRYRYDGHAAVVWECTPQAGAALV